jgi:hypothetical protein
MSQIGPHFGLSRDYDLLVLGLSPFVWTVASCLARDHMPAVNYLLDQALGIMDAVDSRGQWSAGVPTAVWLLHISAALNLTMPYNRASEFLWSNGGVGETALYEPPIFVAFEENLFPYDEPPITMPSMENVREAMREKSVRLEEDVQPEQIALWLMLDPDLGDQRMRAIARHSVLAAMYGG